MIKKDLIESAIKTIEVEKDELINISRYIWENPELGYQEYKASKILIDYLEKHGFDIERNTANLETAFVATKKGIKDGPTIAIISEYDSLGEMGHACGHNLFSVAAVGAGLALSKIVDEVGGTIKVIGTPAEEGIVPDAGGKVPMVEKGVFDNIDIAMMCHAEGRTIVQRELVASSSLGVVFKGKAAHAGGSPHEGINALSAGILTINNINALRQHFLPKVVANIIITEGGFAANTIPDRCNLKMSLRADTISILDDVISKIEACINAGAIATGCTYEINKLSHTYENLITNQGLASTFKEALDYLQEPYLPYEATNYAWDVGNISQICPVIAPYIKIGKENLVGHTDEFREASNSESGYNGMIVGAKAMAITSILYLIDEKLQEQVKEEFDSLKL